MFLRRLVRTYVTLPQYNHKTYFPNSAVHYIQDQAQVEQLGCLNGPLGFDLEWKPSFVSGVSPGRVSVVQLADKENIFIVQLNAMKAFPSILKIILESPDVVKTGVGIAIDAKKLNKDFGINMTSALDLGNVARQADPGFDEFSQSKAVSLQRLVSHYLGHHLDKGNVQLANWEAYPLPEKMLEYAANDAHSAAILFDTITTFAKTLGRNIDYEAASVDPTYVEKPKKLGKAPFAKLATPKVVGLNKPVRKRSVELTENGFPVLSPQRQKAYDLWMAQTDMPTMCVQMRSEENPLLPGSVAEHIIHALATNPSLPHNPRTVEHLAREYIYARGVYAKYKSGLNRWLQSPEYKSSQAKDE